MKIIPTNGIYNFQEIPGSTQWYWCCDYASGDLYEAQELFESRHPVSSNRLLLIRYPEGEVVEPIHQVSARLIVNAASLKLRKQEIEDLAARLEREIQKGEGK